MGVSLEYMAKRYTHTIKKYALPIIQWSGLAALAVWNLWIFWPKVRSITTLSYSQFLDQVNAGNIASVRITGSEIHGYFRPEGQGKQDPVTVQPASSPFQTNYPVELGDPNLIPLLQAKNIQIEVTKPSEAWFSIMKNRVLPPILLVLALIWVSSSKLAGDQLNLSRGKRTLKWTIEQPKVTFEQVGGQADAKLRLKGLVKFLRDPGSQGKSFTHNGGSFLFIGPTGVGKTYLAQALAGEAGVPLFAISVAGLLELSAKEGLHQLSNLFKGAETVAPAIIFLDRLEALNHQSGQTNESDNKKRDLLLHQLLAKMEVLDHRVALIATTEQFELVNPLLFQIGRFKQHISLGMPDRNDRQAILHIHTRGLKLANNVNLNLLARTTPGLSPSGLTALCHQAAKVAIQNDHKQVEMADFGFALENTLLTSNPNLLLDDNERRVIAYHEAGHALASWLIPQAEPIKDISLITPGHAPSAIRDYGNTENTNLSQQHLLACLKVILAGRAAEELSINDITSLGEADLILANRICRSMVTRWGMSNLGLLTTSIETFALGKDHDYTIKSSDAETAAMVNHEIKALLEAQYKEVLNLLQTNRTRLEQLTLGLLEEETLGANLIGKYIGAGTVEEITEYAHP